MSSCLFCRIGAGEIPAKVVFQDAEMLAFEDINPQAPFHALLIPRRHIASLDAMTADDTALLGRLLHRAALLMRERGYAEGGYRAVFNTNADAGQTVFHVHLHVLGGRTLGWPPG